MFSNILELTKKFEKLAAGRPGKPYIKQKTDGTLIVSDQQLDRDDLNAMKSWQDLVDMGVPKNIVGEIARECGCAPRNVDVWMETNSIPYVEEEEYDNDKSYVNISADNLKGILSHKFYNVVLNKIKTRYNLGPNYHKEGVAEIDNISRNFDLIIGAKFGKNKKNKMIISGIDRKTGEFHPIVVYEDLLSSKTPPWDEFAETIVEYLDEVENSFDGNNPMQPDKIDWHS